MPKMRKVPQRSCLGCKQVLPKKQLYRIVRTPNGEVVFDPTGKKAGRGAYICPQVECLEQAIKSGRFEQAFERRVPEAVLDSLRQAIQELPVEHE